MSKDQTVAKGTNMFILTSLRNDCHYSTITIDFTAPVNLTKPSQSIAPIFLKDRKSFTPGFVLPSDNTYYAGNSSYERSRFEERVLKALQLHEELEKDRKQDEQFYSAIPSSTYCQICKQTFTCYQEHISGDDHIRELNSKIGNEYISEICNTFKGKLKKRKGECKVKKIKKTAKKKPQTTIPLTIETRSKKRCKTQQKFGMASKVVNLSINTLYSMGNIY